MSGTRSDARKRLAEQQAAPDSLADKLYAYLYSQPSVNWPERHAEAVAALVAEHYGAIPTHNGVPVTPENLRHAATHGALCRSWIFDVLVGLAAALGGDAS